MNKIQLCNDEILEKAVLVAGRNGYGDDDGEGDGYGEGEGEGDGYGECDGNGYGDGHPNDLGWGHRYGDS